MSAHTKDLLKDSRCSLTVTANDFKGAAQGRVVLIGDVKKLNDPTQQSALRERYLNKHKDAFWIDFGYVFSYVTTHNHFLIVSLLCIQRFLVLYDDFPQLSAICGWIRYGRYGLI